jgi:hypothetical protein
LIKGTISILFAKENNILRIGACGGANGMADENGI